jgi:hypothetical protein
LAKKMPIEKAVHIAETIAKAHLKWGKHATTSYKQEDLLEAIGVLHLAGNFDATPKEDVTKLRRQLAACQNREKARNAHEASSMKDVRRTPNADEHVGSDEEVT